jgi:predicted permease
LAPYESILAAYPGQALVPVGRALRWFAVPALVFAALTVPVQDVTSGIHDVPAWAVIVIGLGALLAGAIAGAAGGRWISGRAPGGPPRRH